MKFKILFLFLLASVCGWGQTIISNTLRTAPLITSWSPINVTHETATGGYARFAANNGSLTTPSFDASSYGSITVSFSVAKYGSGNDGPITILYSTNGTTWISAGTTPIPTSSTYINGSININVASSTIYLRFSSSSSPSEKRFRDVVISGNPPTCTAPTTQATNFTSTVTGQNTATVEWERGSGDNVLVVARAGGAVNADPTSGNSYTANSAFGSGTQIGTGNFVVYNGIGTSVNLTGLTAGTTYHFAVYEYSDTDTCYNTTELTGNLTTQSAPQLTIAGSLTENTTLNGGVVSLTLANETFADGTLNLANFTLNNAPAGVSINSISYVNTTSANLTLAYDGTDFDTNFTNFNITINGSELTSTENLTSNNLTINAQTETLSVNTGTLAFGTVCFGNSADGTFTISGSNLKEGTINLSPLTGYVYSESLGGTAITSFANAAGAFSNKTIYVRFTPPAPSQTYNGNITVSSLTTNSVNKAVTGNSTVTSPTITTNTASLVVNTTANLRGNYGNAGSCYSITEKGFIYARTADNNNPNNAAVNGTTVFKVPVAGVALGDYNSPLSGLSPSTSYTYVAYVTDGTNYFYGITRTFTTLGVATNLEFNPAPPATGGVGINLASFSVRARRADNSLDAEYTGAVTLSKVSGPGNMNGTLTVNAIAGVATFTNISFDDAGTYTIGAVSGSLPTITSGNIVISFVSSYTDYFQSRQNGNWTNVNTWQSSPTGLPGTWINATLYPDYEATSVIIRAEDIVNINSSGIDITNTKVYGTLRVITPGANPFTITGDDDIELEIENGGVLDVSSWGYPSYSSDAFGLVKAGGKIIANPGADTEFFLYDYLDYWGVFIFEDQAIAEWNLSTYPPSSNDLDYSIYNDDIIYPVDENAVPIFRISNISSNSTHAYGSTVNSNLINAVLEINTTIPFNIFNNQNKTFMGGIRGNGSVNIFNNSGNVFIGADDIVPELGGNITLSLPTTDNRFRINNGGIVPTGANFIIQSNNNTENRQFTRVNGTLNINGTLDITNTRLNNNNSGDIVVNDGGKIRTRNTGGLFGAGTAIIDYESKLVMNEGSTAEYYGTSSQTVSNGLEYSNLEITGTGVKSGAIGNIIVNQITKLNDGAKLHILETADSVDPNVLTAKGGINVSSVAGTELLFENNAVLMQDPGVINLGKITQLRNATVPSNQYNYWSIPVQGQNVYSIYDNIPANRVMTYNPKTDYFTIKPNPTTALFGIGYSVKGPSTNAPSDDGEGNKDVTATFIGTPNNEASGMNSIAVTTFDNGDNFNLIGNPFPSNFDLVKMYDGTGNKDKLVNADVYFWDNIGNTEMYQQGSGYNQSNYALYNMASKTGTAAPCTAIQPNTCTEASNKRPNGIVKPGQGFIVNVKQGATSLTVNNAMRTTEIKHLLDPNDAVYFKNGNNLTASDEAQRNDKFWLELINPNETHIEIAVGYFEEAENEFEVYDSEILSESVSDNIYTLSKDDVKLAIQGRKGVFQNDDEIPLGVKIFEHDRYKIQLEETKGIFISYQNIYLKDKSLNIIHNLSDDGPYEFEAPAGVHNDRFEIVFQDGSTPSGPVLTTATQNKINILKRDNQIEISSSRDKIIEVEIFNLSGWSIYKNTQVNQNSLRIPASLLGKQIIIVKIETETGEIQTKKFVNQ